MASDHHRSVKDAGANPPSTSTRLIQSPDMGEGPNAVSWLVGDVNGDGKAEICQQYTNSNGKLGIIVYGWNGTDMVVLKQNDDMGQGPNAINWLIGDVNGDGKAEICQQYKNGNGKLGMVVYGWNGTDMAVLKQNDDMGQGPNAVSWLIGDVNGDGKAEICQQYKNADNGNLGMIVYGWDDHDIKKIWTIWQQDDMGQGPNALTWLIGDVNGDGKAEICQLWDNGGKLAIIFYMWAEDGMHTTVPTYPGWFMDAEASTAGSGWFIGDVNEDGWTEMCHWWSDSSSVGASLYEYFAGKCARGPGARRYYVSSTPPPPVGFVLGDFRGKGRKELCEAYATGGALGMMLFTFFKGSTLKGKAEWGRDNMNQGPNAIAWLAGNFMGPIQDGQTTVQREQICQLWDNNGKLDMIVYGWKGGSDGFQDGDYGDGDGGITVLWPTA
ncbi:FG-GAP repeat domain-containing protein [Bordetella bronchialis]|uniref:Uncharacterized protein n=1 Tax=Bordetella bronchialis TaxID=463025 RepID=A0A193FCI2_9BORD|nr:VCBS repeat-containing protein [Bordetella bronchialis]ANN64978.1 hypothetical protein BAU06_00415 [Bordetella bronchialis]ANN70008.1 hypothetical protein BAU08_00405 [Bordetella bronchialis]